jgi:predicted nucleic acid-binding protein
MASKQDVDAVVVQFALERVPWNDDVLFHAGKAFQKYTATKASKTNVLPDFLIGATADIMKAPLMTVNSRDFVKFFPTLKLIGTRPVKAALWTAEEASRSCD